MTGILSRLSIRFLLPIAIAVQGCSYLGSARDLDPEELRSQPGWVVVSSVPCIIQTAQEDCGVAALQMMVGYYGPVPTREDIEKACPVQPGAGIRAKDLRDFARARGLQAFLIHGDVPDFLTELSRGHPVMVGMVKPYVSGAVTHYEVAVALHQGRQEIVTLDPARGWRSNSLEGFVKEWGPTGRLMLVMFPPPVSDPPPAAQGAPPPP